MYTDIRTILKDASEKNYGVIATSAINMETARGIVAAATEKNAPIIFLLGQNMMRTHAKAELMIPMIRKLAEYTPVPVATCLDHGSDPERIMYAFRNGFSSIMFDGSLYSMEENMRKTKEYADLCHQFNMGIEGELGHVGIAAQGDNLKTDCYTDPKDAADFARFTGVDCLAIAVGTAHGEYPKGLIPHINFDRIRECKKATGGMPIALHGGSGAGDRNILEAVKAGINKINVVTDVFNASRDYLTKTLAENPKIGYIDLMSGMEMAAKHFISHWIDLSGSEGKADNFRQANNISLLAKKETVGLSE
ncbi:MAG: class II fructose-bisphosphate aldolase [Spirochaetales bacterium]|nr:class II fructose-bisphosphate aldolase [Spirochaetales bacterium]MCR5442232.1 class II fructose-bisphosphate aldolase [Sphaerochaetaceae bacterium]MBQ3696454.1 class II fructose-bisphosphate aldolase [Spirochaetales bacterium]MBQ3831386.1 class II fructose-bisphosphate aldolase [Spirochaetales bacterium]MBQ4280897.1 class II fructose-bisphosphate aldolase [Spirochaetales bacterium]